MTTAIAAEGAARAAYQSAHGPKFGVGQCMWRVRLLVDAPAIGDYDGDGAADAEDGWKYASRKHPTSDPATIPGGCIVWWGGGSHDNGHVALADPVKRGYCWSTDILRPGYFDLVPIALIGKKWGLPLYGWSEDIDGVTVYAADTARENPNMALLADLKAVCHQHGATKLRAARVLLRDVRDNPKAGPIRRSRINTALAALKGMK